MTSNSKPSTCISAMEPEFCPRRKPASLEFLALTVFGGSRDAKFVQTTTSYVFRCHKTASSPSCRLLVDHIKLSSVTELKVLSELFRRPTKSDGDT